MACTRPARAARAGAAPPFDDAVDNNPCGKAAVVSIGGVDVSAHSLCLFHLGMKLGLAAIQAPIVMEAPTLRTRQGESLKATPKPTARKKTTARRR